MAVNKARIAIGIGVFLLGAFGGNMLIQYLQENSESNREAVAAAQKMVTKHRPEFLLPDLEGKLRNIGEWDGKVVAVNFWATWCPPCRKEIPAFIELQEQYGLSGLQIVGIAIDEKDSVTDYANTMGINYPILLGDKKGMTTMKDYGDRFGALPYTAIVDRKGDIVFVHRGELSRELAESTIKSVL